MSMSLSDFIEQFERKVKMFYRFNEVDDIDVVVTKSSGKTLFLFMKDQEVLDSIKVSKND
jgi:hypothetical protein